MGGKNITKINEPWEVFEYEILMFFETQKLLIGCTLKDQNNKIIRNVVIESLILHTRLLCDILLSRSKYPDDIVLSDLVHDSQLIELTKEFSDLQNVYGGSKDRTSPCWVFNKLIFHPTTHRPRNKDLTNLLITLGKPLFEVLILVDKMSNNKILKKYLLNKI